MEKSMFLSPSCGSMAPTTKFDASIWTWKITFQSSDFKIGVEVRHYFNLLKDSSHPFVHRNIVMRILKNSIKTNHSPPAQDRLYLGPSFVDRIETCQEH